jgi:hypothetical protein
MLLSATISKAGHAPEYKLEVKRASGNDVYNEITKKDEAIKEFIYKTEIPFDVFFETAQIYDITDVNQAHIDTARALFDKIERIDW